ncbi:hypothetical protein [Arachidicoccus soli]|uniref:Capsule assembly Wzi family protein n=1 Tax=Arachidicoccus soli TaxID=2341117 RepID=A0A386HLC8_9BACT|nr:hypothetical protein [Arachidicoccus soli]AYD46553.1 hypothetical protein D6B99_02315 [Arachidicoccus soli]
MQIKSKFAFVLLLTFFALKVKAQSDNIELSDKQNILINRLDIKLRGDSVMQFTTVKPYNRARITARIEKIDSLYKAGILGTKLSKVDEYNIRSLLMNNSDWTTHYTDSFRVKRPIFNTFFKTPAHLYEVNNPGQYSIIVDPVLSLSEGHSNDGTNTYVNTRGIRFRGQVDNRLGYYFFFSENQERDPLYVRQYTNAHYGLPGKGYYKNYGTNAYDYFDARGGVTFHAGKNMDFQVGYDRFFIGDGYRSLFLSDNSAPFYFVKFGLQAGKVKYTAVGAQTIAPFITNNDSTRPRNYMMFHYLTWQATNWLKVGFYENTMYNSKINGGFQVSYLNPATFNRGMSQATGNSAKSSIGLDFKANFAKHFQAYGQWLINEFHIDKIFEFGKGNWVNKEGFQLGGKYIDAFTVKNLDLQLEGNIVRPFTYMDKWTQNNFTHYNQPLADPLGANFKEVIAIANYQPLPKLSFTAKAIFYKKGLDTSAAFATAIDQPNYGGDLFRNYNDMRMNQDGYFPGQGAYSVNALLGSLTASYEVIQNLFIDANLTYRRYDIDTKPKDHTKMFSIGLRWNIARRAFNF